MNRAPTLRFVLLPREHGSRSLAFEPVALAPLGALFVVFDRRNEMRAAEAEIAGSAAFALLPATFASLAG